MSASKWRTGLVEIRVVCYASRPSFLIIATACQHNSCVAWLHGDVQRLEGQSGATNDDCDPETWRTEESIQ